MRDYLIGDDEFYRKAEVDERITELEKSVAVQKVINKDYVDLCEALKNLNGHLNDKIHIMTEMMDKLEQLCREAGIEV